MANKTIYFKDDALWDRAKELAGKDGLSAMIQEALAQYVERKNLEAKGFKHFRLETAEYDPVSKKLGTTERIAFEGRELAMDEAVVPSGETEPDGEPGYFVVAIAAYQTKADRLILTRGEAGYGEIITKYEVLSSLKEIRESDLLADVQGLDRARFLDEISSKLGEEWSVWID
jgi:hypothetical protein